MASSSDSSCQSDPNFAVICAFLERFAKSFEISYPPFLDLQEMLENTDQVPQQLADLHIKLLRKARKTVSIEKWERAVIKFCYTYSEQDAWEIERFGYKKSKIDVKLRVLKSLLECQFDFNPKFKASVNMLTADELRSRPMGKDKLGRFYWTQFDPSGNLRVYRDDPDDETWLMVAKDRESFVALATELAEGDETFDVSTLAEENLVTEVDKPVLDTGQENKDEKSVSNEKDPLENESTSDEDQESEDTNDQSDNTQTSENETKESDNEPNPAKKPKLDEVSEEIVEPTMIITGPGSGAECEGFNTDVGEEIEEPIMFVFGEGCGASCETGNPEKSGNQSEEKQKESSEGEQMNTAASSSDSPDKVPPKLWSIDTICGNVAEQQPESNKHFSPFSIDSVLEKPSENKETSESWCNIKPGQEQGLALTSPRTPCALDTSHNNSSLLQPQIISKNSDTTANHCEVNSNLLTNPKVDIPNTEDLIKASTSLSSPEPFSSSEPSESEIRQTLSNETVAEMDKEKSASTGEPELSLNKKEKNSPTQADPCNEGTNHEDNTELQNNQSITSTENNLKLEDTNQTKMSNEPGTKQRESELDIQKSHNNPEPIKQCENHANLDFVESKSSENNYDQMIEKVQKKSETLNDEKLDKVAVEENTQENPGGNNEFCLPDEQHVSEKDKSIEEKPKVEGNLEVKSTNIEEKPKAIEEENTTYIKEEPKAVVVQNLKEKSNDIDQDTKPVADNEESTCEAVDDEKSSNIEKEFKAVTEENYEKLKSKSEVEETSSHIEEEPKVIVKENLENKLTNLEEEPRVVAKKNPEEKPTNIEEEPRVVAKENPEEKPTNTEEEHKAVAKDNPEEKPTNKEEEPRVVSQGNPEENPTNVVEDPRVVAKENPEEKPTNTEEEHKAVAKDNPEEKPTNTEEEHKTVAKDNPEEKPTNKEEEPRVVSQGNPEENPTNVVEEPIVVAKDNPEEKATNIEEPKVVAKEKPEEKATNIEEPKVVAKEKPEEKATNIEEPKVVAKEKPEEKATNIDEEPKVVAKDNPEEEPTNVKDKPRVVAKENPEKKPTNIEEEQKVVAKDNLKEEPTNVEEESKAVAKDKPEEKPTNIEEQPKEVAKDNLQEKSINLEEPGMVAEKNLEEKSIIKEEEPKAVAEEKPEIKSTMIEEEPEVLVEDKFKDTLTNIEDKPQPVDENLEEIPKAESKEFLQLKMKDAKEKSSNKKVVSEEHSSPVEVAKPSQTEDVSKQENKTFPKDMAKSEMEVLGKTEDSLSLKQEPDDRVSSMKESNQEGDNSEECNEMTLPEEEKAEISNKQKPKGDKSELNKPSSIKNGKSSKQLKKQKEKCNNKKDIQLNSESDIIEKTDLMFDEKHNSNKLLLDASENKMEESEGIVGASNSNKVVSSVSKDKKTKVDSANNKVKKNENKIEDVTAERSNDESKITPESGVAKLDESSEILEEPVEVGPGPRARRSKRQKSQNEQPTRVSTRNQHKTEAIAPAKKQKRKSRDTDNEEKKEEPVKIAEVELEEPKFLDSTKDDVDPLAVETPTQCDPLGLNEQDEPETKGKRKRRKTSDANSVSEDVENSGGKRIKTKGKKTVDVNARKKVEEKREKVESSDEEGEKIEKNQKETDIKRGRPKKKKKGRRVKTEEEKQKTEDGEKEKVKEWKHNVPARELKNLQMNMDLNDLPGVRHSRRIAQIKLKEEAERRRAEEERLEAYKKKEKGKKHKKKKKGESEEDEIQEKDDDSSDFTDEKKKKKRKKKDKLVFDEHNPWASTSGSSSSAEEEEDIEEEEGPDEEELFKSDHEFSPESDVEDPEYKPMKRARTAKVDGAAKDASTLDYEDTACEKCCNKDHPEWILLCDGCDKGWHASCVRPALLVVPEGDWHCPPCEHTALLANLRENLIRFDKLQKQRENEKLRKQRLAFVGISLDNVLPARKEKKSRPAVQYSGSESESESASSSGSSQSGSSDAGSSEPVYQLRERRSNVTSYRYNEYDELIKSAIQDEMEAVKGTGVGKGKDMNTIVQAEKQGEDDQGETTNEFGAKNGEEYGVDTEDDGGEPIETAQPEAGEEEEELPPVVPKDKTRKKGKRRAITSLDFTSEEDDDNNSDSDFKGGSDDEESEASLPSESDLSSDYGRRRKKGYDGPVRRSTRARVARYDREFINDDSDDAPRRKKSRNVWASSESSDTDGSWGRKKKRSGRRNRSSKPRSARKPSKPKRKKPKRNLEEDKEFGVPKRSKNKKIKFGGLDSPEDNAIVERRTRGKKINYIEDDSDSEEAIRASIQPKPKGSDEEFKEGSEEDIEDEMESDEDDAVASSDDSNSADSDQGKKPNKHEEKKKRKEEGESSKPKKPLSSQKKKSFIPDPDDFSEEDLMEDEELDEVAEELEDLDEEEEEILGMMLEAGDIPVHELKSAVKRAKEEWKKKKEAKAAEAKSKEKAELKKVAEKPAFPPIPAHLANPSTGPRFPKIGGHMKITPSRSQLLGMQSVRMPGPDKKVLPLPMQVGAAPPGPPPQPAMVRMPPMSQAQAPSVIPQQPQQQQQAPMQQIHPMMQGHLNNGAPPPTQFGPFSEHLSPLTRMQQNFPTQNLPTTVANMSNMTSMDPAKERRKPGPKPGSKNKKKTDPELDEGLDDGSEEKKGNRARGKKTDKGEVTIATVQAPTQFPAQALAAEDGSVITRMLNTPQGPQAFGAARPPSSYPGPGPRPSLSPTPVRLRAPAPTTLYHSGHPMDPSPSGGGPITISGAKPAVPTMARYPPEQFPPTTSSSNFSQFPNFFNNYPPPQSQPGGEPQPFVNPPFTEPFEEPPTAAPSEPTSNRQFDEEPGGGEFGGLASYFASQHEDGLDT